MDDLKKKLFQIFSRVFNISIEEVNVSLKPEDVEKWDSINHIMLLLTIESEFKFKFSDEEMVSAGNLEQLINLVQNKIKNV